MNLLQALRNFKPSQALPRMLADFLTIHFSMLVGLLLPVFCLLFWGETASAALRLAGAKKYYIPYFLILSALFPPVFLLNGFYTRSRTYISRYKIIVVIQGFGTSILIFMVCNFLFFRSEMVPRISLVLFSFLATIIGPLSRFSKMMFERRYKIRPRRSRMATHADPAILVLGGAGYIGSVVVRKLLDIGKRVRVFDSLIYGDGPIAAIREHPNLELQVGDCRNIQDMVAAIRGVESIIDLAAIVGDSACELDRQTTLEINYAATKMLIELAKGFRINRMIFASSCSVYGATDVIVDENSGVQPISLYGQTKVDSEKALLLAHGDNFHPVILRFATIFGLSYRPRFDLVVNLLTAKAWMEGKIIIFNGEQWRPFIHVQDVADGLLKVLAAPLDLVSGQVYNLGDTRLNLTLSQLAEKIQEIFPGTEVEHIENADRRNYCVSFDKIRDQLEFEASRDLGYGISELKRAFEQKEIVDYTNARYHNQKFLKMSGTPLCKEELDEHLMAAFTAAPKGNHVNLAREGERSPLEAQRARALAAAGGQ
jgi:nucleoside-diphosphate-sugar epimerase